MPQLTLELQVRGLHRVETMTRHPGYFDILLRAPEGPYSTREHRFELEAARRDEHSTVVHLRYSYEYGALANIFMKSYFAIFGRSKVASALQKQTAGIILNM